MNPDLAQERGRATFDPEQVTNLLYRGPENVRKRRYLQNAAIQDQVLARAKPWAFQDRMEQYETALWKHLYMTQKLDEMGISDPMERMYYTEAGAPHEYSPLSLHTGMFIPSIEKQGTKEQRDKWLPLARSLQLIGTYAQTEMGHGTFIRGLETTATYVPTNQEFVLNSPTITSMKYWPGGLGKTSNCCLVMAQLITQGEKRGIHLFFVQIRDIETHQPMPGVESGDIGTKFGFGSNDNGYLKLTNARIPRENMLMRYSKVLEDGTYVPPKNQRIGYGTMVFVRAHIVTNSARGLAKACVIAIRYSAVRRQTEVSPGGMEAQILDYQTQQYKLLPLLASAFAMYFTGRYAEDYYEEIASEIEEGKLDSLNQLHAVCAGLKAFVTWVCTAGIETCRLCCGGHGYSHASGLPKLYVFYTPGCTYEGENNVMMLQVARFLMKLYPDIKRNVPIHKFVDYLGADLTLKSCMTAEVAIGCLLKAYEHRAARLLSEAASRVESLVRSGKSHQEAWNASTVVLTWAAKAYCHAFVFRTFSQIVTDAAVDKNTKDVLTALCKLYAVHGILENLGEFIQDGFFSPKQVSLLKNKLADLLAEIRPNAVALVDAFDYPDKVLDSCLGRYDGQVYQALYDYAKSSPLNQQEVLDSYHKYIKPAQLGQSTRHEQPMARL
uniref:Acyl-coenzyme A oxidase n=1 Tax=Crassostrea virginica TaxID=6565 RepID=A0A8B8E8S9_CRAVI|nr:peroxisomal acyl-coenzyme A oxidase 1-like isoform X1 [Crassostrea virginica]XP_022336087.1 peroxisomal acyl-coenzyme A oxidase 1-like isoform X1 [Crassostrea virginica]